MRPGPKKGYKQSPEHVAKRKRFGDQHPNWKGDAVSIKGRRSRALRAYPEIGPCSACGDERAERHHRDGDTTNNAPENIAILCRKCHMTEDGRLESVREMARAQQPKAIAARW